MEDRVREFAETARYLADHRLLLWNPEIEEQAAALVAAVRKIMGRRGAARSKSL